MSEIVLLHGPGLAVLQHGLADPADDLAVARDTPAEEGAVVTQVAGDSLLGQLQLLVNRADLAPEQ